MRGSIPWWCGLVALACRVGVAQAGPEPVSPGARLFDGSTPLAARVSGQDLALPAHASRCVNCHLDTAPVAVPGLAASGSRRFGPALTPALLRESQRRRGGPPSRYDGAAFCRLLRTGIDPASVIIDRSMPRYQVSDAECATLWTHLAGAP